MDNNRLPAAGGLRKKLFLLCSLLVIIASMAFALIGILQLRDAQYDHPGGKERGR